MVDSDFADDNIDRKSTTGFVIRMFGNIIYWKVQKQKTVTKNSTFAEYIALSEVTTEILFVINLLKDAFNTINSVTWQKSLSTLKYNVIM